MNSTITINQYNIFNGKVFGRVGENSLGFKKGRFMSTKIVKQLGKMVTDELGLNYLLGSALDQPLWQTISLSLIDFCSTVSSSDPRPSLAQMLRDDFNIEVDFAEVDTTSKAYSTIVETKFNLLLGGVRFNFVMTCSPTTGRYTLDCDR